ncbi:hypothetical protein [Mangrovihabitans endophyticus]|uniref:Exonuclease n=1 Tax=Mangrovihabitans endophyticus TaxID=1751298 RepID=A0A8J3C033_9ACTN|nr:hypothetical protein [Mangrovihabitans endophyticus]GGK89396.1 hypothetical protein GCM10012284_24190 [Mangrovihabitans endophyticus]
MTRIVFVDTETTSLRPDRRAWDVALIVRDPGAAADDEYQWFVHADHLALDNADPRALQVGRFYDRHPDYRSKSPDPLDPWVGGGTPEFLVMREVERLTRGAHLVGAVPNFDAEVLGARMRVQGLCPSWHYHLIDVEALAVGYLAATSGLDMTRLPWDSGWLTAQLGLAPVPDKLRHTALGDASWARSIYDRVTAGQQDGDTRA